jgi:methionine sulfoxide reductase heme-binding subunit
MTKSTALTLKYIPIYDRQGNLSWLKAVALLLLVAPAAWLVGRSLAGDLGALPIMEAIHVSGEWALRFLVLTLALTPLQRIFSWPKLALVRRMIGVASFAYGAIHLALFIANSKFNVVFVASEIIQRFYLLIGFVALLGLTVLASTSTDAAISRMGQTWKQLHKLIYVIASLALVHAAIQYKVDSTPAFLLAGFFALLMIYRLLISRRWVASNAALFFAAIAASILTASAEFAWYALTSGVNPWRILQANLAIHFGLRPALIVLLTGFTVTAIRIGLPWMRRLSFLSDKKTIVARANAAN